MPSHAYRSCASRRVRGAASGLHLVAAIALLLLVSPSAASAGTGVSAVAFGENLHTELGAGYRTVGAAAQENSPVAVVTRSDISEVAAEKWATLALLENGELVAWGHNEKGQLGDGHLGTAAFEKEGELGDGWGTWEDFGVPYVWVSPVEERHSENKAEREAKEKALEKEEQEERRGERERKARPHLKEVKAIAGHGEHVIALLDSGKVAAWGDNRWGTQGNGINGFQSEEGGEIADTPKGVPSYVSEVKGTELVLQPLEHVELIAAAGETNYAVFEGGKQIVAWGGNLKGQLGIGEAGPGGHPEWCKNNDQGETREGYPGKWEPCSKYPRKVVLPEAVTTGEAHITAISAFGETAYMLLSNGEVWSWGSNGRGELGDGSSEKTADTPQRIAYFAGHPAETISAGEDHALALLRTKAVVAWGSDQFGELGRKATSMEECSKVKCLRQPAAVEGVAAASSVAAGFQDSFVVNEGIAYAFGKNVTGELGLGTANETENYVPTAVSGIGSVGSVIPGNAHTIVLLQSGVAPPAPLVTATGTGTTLTVHWAPHGQKGVEYTSRIAPFDREHPAAPRFGKTAHIAEAGSYASNWASGEFTWNGPNPESHSGLTPGERYVIVISSPTSTRWIAAEP